MSSYDEAYDGYKQVHHEGKFSHELVAGAAAFAGIHEWEKRQREEGNTVSHGAAKEFLGAIVAAEADKLIESKGRDYYDEEKLKWDAKKHAEKMYDQQYENQASQWSPDLQQNAYTQQEHHHHHRRD